VHIIWQSFFASKLLFLFVDNLAQRRRAGVRQLFHCRGNRGALPCSIFFLCFLQLAPAKGIVLSAATVEVSSLFKYYVDSQIVTEVSKPRGTSILMFELSKSSLEGLNLQMKYPGILCWCWKLWGYQSYEGCSDLKTLVTFYFYFIEWQTNAQLTEKLLFFCIFQHCCVILRELVVSTLLHLLVKLSKVLTTSSLGMTQQCLNM
jgi:hypothetical protein